MPKANNEIVLRENIVRTLLYYDIFNYPLTGNEIFRFLGVDTDTENGVLSALTHMVAEGVIFRHGDLYGIHPTEANFSRRIKGNREALRFLPIAKHKAAFISKFPFIRGVMASGSLAKGYMDEKSDLDFFVVTAPGRLWIARTILVMYKRLFLFNSHKYFCVNYFVDEVHLEIEEKNLFTATELATVIPLSGATLYGNLMQANPWLRLFFPNYEPRPTQYVPESPASGIKKTMERILDLLAPETMERYFRDVTVKRWKRLYKKDYPAADFDIAFKSKDYASKNHPQHFQRKVMGLYAEKLKGFDFHRIRKQRAGADIQSQR